MDRRTIRPERVQVACPHCSGSRYILDEVETCLGEFETVSYPCHMCCATGRKMDRAERKAYSESLKAGL